MLPIVSVHCTLYFDSLVDVVFCRFERAGDEDADDDAVDGDDTRHDDGDDRLHDQLGPHHRHRRDSRPGLGSAVRRTHCAAWEKDTFAKPISS